jgi:predicted Fe-Mo cluster-binding NifX family protein
MKIAVDSNDGINIASPFNLLKNFMVFEVGGGNDPLNFGAPRTQSNNKNKLKQIKNISKTVNIASELSECSTVISHGLNRPLLNNLRKSGVDVFITYQARIDDALNQYLKDKSIHEFH